MQAQKRNEKLTVLPGFFTLSPVPPNGARENATFHVCLFFFLYFFKKFRMASPKRSLAFLSKSIPRSCTSR